MIVGRGPEKAALSGLIQTAREGRQTALLMSADPGMGKTTLLDYVQTEAQDFTVLRATGSDSETDFPYAGLHEFLLPAFSTFERIPDVQAHALRGALAISAAPGAVPLSVGAGVLSTITVLATERPVLCVVDDADLLDDASAAAMQFAFRRLHGERIAVIVAGESQELPLGTRPAQILVVNGLGSDDASTLLQEASDGAAAPAVVKRLWEQTGGNPGALLEAVDLLSDAQLAGVEPLPEPLPVTVGVPRRLQAEVEKLSDEGRRALLHASIAGTRTHRVIHRDDLTEGMAEVEDVGLVTVSGGTVSIGHRLTPTQVARMATPEERRKAHLQIAQSLSEERHRELRLWHLAAAATGPDPALAAELATGALGMRSTHGHGAAVGLLDTAARLTPEPQLRDAYTLDAARSAWLSGQPDKAAALLSRMAVEPHDEAFTLNRRLLQMQLRWAADNVTTEPDDTVVPSSDPERGVAWLIAASLSEEPNASLDLARQARELAERGAPSASWATEFAILRALDAVEDAPSVQSAIDAAGALSWDSIDGRDEMLIEVLQCLTVWTPNRAPWLGRALDRLSELAHQHTVSATPLVAMAIGDAAFWAGRWADAVISYNTARSRAMDTGQDLTKARAEARMRAIDVLRGNELQEDGLQGMPASVGTALHILGSMANAKPQDAVELQNSVDWPALCIWVPPGSLTPVDVAEAAVRVQDTSLQIPAASWSYERSWIAALTQDESAEALEGCLRVVDTQNGRNFSVGRLLLAIGQRQLRSQNRAEARQNLRRAHDIFARLGAIGWADQTRNELAATGVRVPAVSLSPFESLTPRELQIARCIASGATYKEAAAELFLSVKTIEWYLAGVYRKLDIRSRRDLGARLTKLEIDS